DLVQAIGPSWPAWAGRLAWAAFTVALAAAAAAMLRRLVRRWAGKAAERTGDLLRLRRQETAAALLANILRYGVFLVAAFAILGIFVRDSLTALGGASLLVLVVGFSAQRFLTDVVAGFFLLFEGQYGVGDFVTLEPSKLSGIVDDLGLRTTTLRALNGDRYFVPNGEITAVHRSARGFRPYHVELLTQEPDQAEQAIAGIGSKPGEA